MQAFVLIFIITCALVAAIAALTFFPPAEEGHDNALPLLFSFV